jgi:hypothetical protein
MMQYRGIASMLLASLASAGCYSEVTVGPTELRKLRYADSGQTAQLKNLEGEIFEVSSSRGTHAVRGFARRGRVSAWSAAARLPETRSLWLVDQTEDKPVRTRILRYDFQTQTMHPAGKWPRMHVILTQFVEQIDSMH